MLWISDIKWPDCRQILSSASPGFTKFWVHYDNYKRIF